jgi:hypothetical protein
MLVHRCSLFFGFFPLLPLSIIEPWSQLVRVRVLVLVIVCLWRLGIVSSIRDQNQSTDRNLAQKIYPTSEGPQGAG